MVLFHESSIQSPMNPDCQFESSVGLNPFIAHQKSDPDSLVTSQLPMSNGNFILSKNLNLSVISKSRH